MKDLSQTCGGRGSLLPHIGKIIVMQLLQSCGINRNIYGLGIHLITNGTYKCEYLMLLVNKGYFHLPHHGQQLVGIHIMFTIMFFGRGGIVPYWVSGKPHCGDHYHLYIFMSYCKIIRISIGNGILYTKVVRRNSFRHNRVVIYYADHAWDIHPPLHPVIYSVSHVQENISLYWGGRASTCRNLFIHLTCCWVLPLRLELMGIYGIGECESELRRRLAGNSCYSGIVCYLCNSLCEGHVFWFFSLLTSWGRK